MQGMLGVMWICCLLGVSMSSLYFGPARKYANLFLFLVMGWSVRAADKLSYCLYIHLRTYTDIHGHTRTYTDI